MWPRRSWLNNTLSFLTTLSPVHRFQHWWMHCDNLRSWSLMNQKDRRAEHASPFLNTLWNPKHIIMSKNKSRVVREAVTFIDIPLFTGSIIVWQAISTCIKTWRRLSCESTMTFSRKTHLNFSVLRQRQSWRTSLRRWSVASVKTPSNIRWRQFSRPISIKNSSLFNGFVLTAMLIYMRKGQLPSYLVLNTNIVLQ